MKNDNEKSKKEEKVDKESPKGTNEAKDNKEVEDLKKKLEETEGSYKRALADYQNLQRRVEEDKANWILTANRELLLRLLPVLDTLMLAQNHIKDEGLKVSINQFLDVLKSDGVTKIEVAGKNFDPATMEAIAIDEGEDGKVLEEIRAGYMMQDKVLRAAQVKVGKGK